MKQLSEEQRETAFRAWMDAWLKKIEAVKTRKEFEQVREAVKQEAIKLKKEVADLEDAAAKTVDAKRLEQQRNRIKAEIDKAQEAHDRKWDEDAESKEAEKYAKKVFPQGTEERQKKIANEYYYRKHNRHREGWWRISEPLEQKREKVDDEDENYEVSIAGLARQKFQQTDFKTLRKRYCNGELVEALRKKSDSLKKKSRPPTLTAEQQKKRDVEYGQALNQATEAGASAYKPTK